MRSAIAAYGLASVYVLSVKCLGLQARPETSMGLHQSMDAFAAFPSGHAVWGALAAMLPFFQVRGSKATMSAAWVLSVSTCLLRIVAKKHWPQNVLAGLAILFRSAQTTMFLQQPQLVNNRGLVNYHSAATLFEVCALGMSMTTAMDSSYNRMAPWILFSVINGVNAVAVHEATGSWSDYIKYTAIAPVYGMATEPLVTIKNTPIIAITALMTLLLLVMNVAAIGNHLKGWKIPFTSVGGSMPEQAIIYEGIDDSVSMAADILSYVTGSAAMLMAIIMLMQQSRADEALNEVGAMAP